MLDNRSSNEQDIEIDGVDYLVKWVDYKCTFDAISSDYYVELKSIEIAKYDDEIGDYIVFTPSSDLLEKIESHINDSIDWYQHEQNEKDYYDELNYGEF
jgi:hypothetical protein